MKNFNWKLSLWSAAVYTLGVALGVLMCKANEDMRLDHEYSKGWEGACKYMAIELDKLKKEIDEKHSKKNGEQTKEAEEKAE